MHDELWLDVGAHPLGFHVTHHPLEDAGPFTPGGAKTVCHTTEGGTVDTVLGTLNTNRTGVHFVHDPRTGQTAQCIAFNRAGRGLEHESGPETNRANAIQIEIIGFATAFEAGRQHQPDRWVGTWTDREYGHLAALMVAIERHHGTPRTVRNFTKPVKFTGTQFVTYAGICGHVHVPGNVHTDPGTAFQGQRLRRTMNALDARG